MNDAVSHSSTNILTSTNSTDSSGITGCILARNEEARIEAALQSLNPWCDQIIVLDNESADQTASIAARYNALVISVPSPPDGANFDALRSEAIAHATSDWIFYLDADERVPSRLGPILQQLIRDHGDTFEGLVVPFKSYFCGKWIQHSGWWPGYTRPQLLKKGAFTYGARLHSGVTVNGRTKLFPADDPDLAITHYSYDSIHHYLDKLNRYTDGEAINLQADGHSHAWQAQLAHFVKDWQWYYDKHQGRLDGMHGFVLAFLSAAYRLMSRAKLWDLRRKKGELQGEEAVPASVHEMLSFMSQIAREGIGSWLEPGNREKEPETGSAAGMRPIPPHWYAAALEAGSGSKTAPKPRTRKNNKTASDMVATDEADKPAQVLDSSKRIAACIIARNEGGQIGEALRSLSGWADRIVVVDHGSTDDTVAVARKAGATVLSAPQDAGSTFEEVRVALAAQIHDAAFADADWLLYLDADERVGPKLGPLLKQIVAEHGDAFDALHLPMKNVMYGKWMQSGVWWPGYKGPQLVKKNTFTYSPVIHTGVLNTTGHALRLPGDDPELAIVHYSYADLHQYLEKLNRYTTASAPVLAGAGIDVSWQAHLAVFTRAWHVHYDGGHAARDGMHGFVQSFLCSFYEFVTVAKAWEETRRRIGYLDSRAESVPASLGEMLHFMQSHLEAVSGTGRSNRSSTSAASPTRESAILIQCASGDQTSLLELTRARHEAYASAHGMDYVGRFGPQQTERSPHWDKIVLLLTALRLKRHSLIAILDADTLIENLTVDLRAALPASCWLGMVLHGGIPNNPRTPYFNNGVMIVRNTPEALTFFEEVWQVGATQNAWEADNEAVLKVLARGSDKWSARGVAVIGDEWNSTQLQNEHPHPVIRAWHGYGTPAQRLPSMRQFLERTTQAEQGGQAKPEKASPLRLPSAHPVPLDPVQAVNFKTLLGRPLRVCWEGDQLFLSSLALVNRELCLGLLEAGDVELTLRTPVSPEHNLTETHDPRFGKLLSRRNVPLSGPPDITVRHHYPPDWSKPLSGRFVVMQPWELSHLPTQEWVEGANKQADVVWANSRFVRDVFVRSGVSAERVHLLPEGVRTDVFTPDGDAFALPTNKTTRFLFVGGAIDRKGADLLLAAYLKAFTRNDDVCLVVKDMGTRTFYRGVTFVDAFRRAQADPNAPEIIYMDDDLSEAELASLYRACTCVVIPYRGEGFCLPPLEGMACGLPAIVTAGGPTDDYLDDTMALRVPARHNVLYGHYRKYPKHLDVDPWMLEPDGDALIAALRWVATHPEETKQKGDKARAHIVSGWTWERAAAVARKELFDLVAGDTKIDNASPTATLWAEPAAIEASDAPASGKRKSKATSTKRAKALETAVEPGIELSLCLIARDEEARIGACLESIRPFVDEMIVVDTGSTDKTRQIALACGARVYDFPWTNSFAEARNQSLNLARGQWIFWMDADDVIDADCGAKLRELIAQHQNRDAAYQVSVHIPPGENEYSASVVDHVKLFPNRPDLRFEHRIHEQILPSLRKANIPILPSDVFVTHEHYDRSPEGQAKKRQRDFTLLSLDLQDYPEHPFVLFNLGMTHLYATHEYEVAAHYLERSLRGSHWKDSIVRKTFALLTTARTAQQEWELALKANEAGRSHYPGDAELLFQAGQIYQQVGRFDDARTALETLTAPQAEEGSGHYRSVDVGLRTYRGQQELALLFARMGDKGHAVQILQGVVREHPHYRPAQADLAALVAKGNPA